MAKSANPAGKHAKPVVPKDRQFVTSLARGLSLLRCFSSVNPERGATELARMTGLPQPTVWRLCHTMIELGFLTPVQGSDKLRLGTPILGLGYAVLAGNPVSEIARPHMEAIANKYQGSVSLAERDGLEMIFLQRCKGRSVVLDFNIGSRVPIGFSASGWGYIAAVAPDERLRIFRELRTTSASQWRSVKPKLDFALLAYERSGYIISKGISHSMVNAVAVPVTSSSKAVRLILSSGGINSIFDDARLKLVGEDLKALADTLRPSLRAAG